MYSRNYIGWTKAEKARIERALELGCCIGGLTDEPLEVHHLLLGGKRMGHWYTIVLARPYHQNTLAWITSLGHGSKAFTAAYGTQRSLFEATQRRLGLPCDWPVSKIVQRMPLGRDWA